jgi:hypothetical protein
MVGSVKMMDKDRDELPTWDDVPDLQLEEVKPEVRRSNPVLEPSQLDELFSIMWPSVSNQKPVQH